MLNSAMAYKSLTQKFTKLVVEESKAKNLSMPNQKLPYKCYSFYFVYGLFLCHSICLISQLFRSYSSTLNSLCGYFKFLLRHINVDVPQRQNLSRFSRGQSVSMKVITMLKTEILSNILVWKFCVNVQCLQNFE